jgi:putative DNA primase/helicase
MTGPDFGGQARALIANVLLALMSKLLIVAIRGMPCWIGDGPWPVKETLPARNGLFNLRSLAEGIANHIPPTPKLFSTFVLDYEILTKAEPPKRWLNFLGGLWQDRPDCIQTLQEFMGYLLTPDTSQQKMLLITGPTRSGKGTIARVMTSLVGERNVAGPTASSLKTNFGLQELVGKLLAILADAQLKKHDDTLVERLKMISGEDLITIDKKYSDPFSVKLSSRLVILTNDLPRFKDTSGALANRMLILPLTKSFLGHEDPTLGPRLQEELPGILLWAVEGWKRLNERGRFVQPESGLMLLKELQDLSSSVGQFVRERCRVDNPLDRIPREDLYDAYLNWCEEEKLDYPLSANTFGGELRSVVPDLGQLHASIEGKRVRCYTGVAVKE